MNLDYSKPCYYCGTQFKIGKRPLPTRDHKIPRIRGGAGRSFNLVQACQSCNSRKNSLTIDEYRFWRSFIGEINLQFPGDEPAKKRDFLFIVSHQFARPLAILNAAHDY